MLAAKPFRDSISSLVRISSFGIDYYSYNQSLTKSFTIRFKN